jgi:hypothetical protein
MLGLTPSAVPGLRGPPVAGLLGMGAEYPAELKRSNFSLVIMEKHLYRD